MRHAKVRNHWGHFFLGALCWYYQGSLVVAWYKCH